MRYAIPILTLVLLTVAQSSLSPNISLLGGKPDFVLIAIIIIAIERGSIHGMLWALAGGLLLDLNSAGPVGASAIALIPLAFLAGLGSRPGFQIQLVRPLLLVPVTTLCYYLVVMLIYQESAMAINWRESMILAVAPSAIYDLLLTPLFYIPIHAVIRRLQPAVQW